jgi:hypothetical protein
MTPTMTAPDPAVFPADVVAFAAERGVTDYLVPLYDLARRCFPGADVAVEFESDYEIAGLSWVVYAVTVSHWELERIQSAYRNWLAEFSDACPPDASAAFVLGKR